MAELTGVKVLAAKDREKAVVLRFSVKKTDENAEVLKEITEKAKTLVTLTVA